jgi:hypothetical protein
VSVTRRDGWVREHPKPGRAVTGQEIVVGILTVLGAAFVSAMYWIGRGRNP